MPWRRPATSRGPESPIVPQPMCWIVSTQSALRASLFHCRPFGICRVVALAGANLEALQVRSGQADIQLAPRAVLLRIARNEPQAVLRAHLRDDALEDLIERLVRGGE